MCEDFQVFCFGQDFFNVYVVDLQGGEVGVYVSIVFIGVDYYIIGFGYGKVDICDGGVGLQKRLLQVLLGGFGQVLRVGCVFLGL